MGGAGKGHTATGYQGKAQAKGKPTLTGPKAARDAATACLEANKSWSEFPPANSGVQPNQQTKAQELIDDCDGATGVSIAFEADGYPKSIDAGETPPVCAPRSVPGGCDGSRPGPGCGIGTVDVPVELLSFGVD